MHRASLPLLMEDLKHQVNKHMALVASFENFFNAKFKEAQTLFESRLLSEPASVADNHFTPGNPFAFWVGLEFSFDLHD